MSPLNTDSINTGVCMQYGNVERVHAPNPIHIVLECMKLELHPYSRTFWSSQISYHQLCTHNAKTHWQGFMQEFFAGGGGLGHTNWGLFVI